MVLCTYQLYWFVLIWRNEGFVFFNMLLRCRCTPLLISNVFILAQEAPFSMAQSVACL